MTKFITDTARIAELERQVEIMAGWVAQIHKAVEKSSEVDKTVADMLDNLNAQINGLTNRYETHGHITSKGNTTSHPKGMQ